MSKGVSAVIAVILILMITVALAAMAYVWFTNIFQELTEGAGGAATQTATALGTSFTIDSAAYNSNDDETVVTIRNTGSQNIDLTSMAFFINDFPANITTDGQSNASSILVPDRYTDTPFELTNSTAAGAVCPGPTVLKATVGAGFTQSKTIACP